MEETSTVIEDNSSLYEMIFMQEDEAKSLPVNIIEKHGGKILEDRPLVKVRFSYPIKKKTMGFFGVIRFSADAEKISLINADMKFQEGIHRFMTSKFIESQNAGLNENSDRDQRGRRSRFARPAEKKPEGYVPVLSNEALEKKIEEILQ